MTDLRTLESELIAAIAAANDEAALENVRIAALGKSGSVSALLKTLGSMTPDERKAQGPLIKRPQRGGERSACSAQGRLEGRRAR